MPDDNLQEAMAGMRESGNWYRKYQSGYPKVAPFKCMLSKSRGVLFLSVQKFDALTTGIRFDKILTASLLNGFKTWSLSP